MHKTQLRYIASLVFSLCLGLSVVQVAVADTAQNEATKSIQAAYNRKDAAAARKDVEGYWATRTENFV